MGYISKDERKPLPLPPEGQHAAVCVDFIGPWRAVDDYDKKKPYVIKKVAWVFQIEPMREDGKHFELASPRYSESWGKKAKMRAFLGQVRGKPFTDEEAKAGQDIESLVKGKWFYVSVAHVTSTTGKVRAEISGIMPMPKGAPTFTLDAYTRAPWWEKVATEDGAEADALDGAQAAQKEATATALEDFPDALKPGDDDTDPLPF